MYHHILVIGVLPIPQAPWLTEKMANRSLLESAEGTIYIWKNQSRTTSTVFYSHCSQYILWTEGCYKPYFIEYLEYLRFTIRFIYSLVVYLPCLKNMSSSDDYSQYMDKQSKCSKPPISICLEGCTFDRSTAQPSELHPRSARSAPKLRRVAFTTKRDGTRPSHRWGVINIHLPSYQIFLGTEGWTDMFWAIQI